MEEVNNPEVMTNNDNYAQSNRPKGGAGCLFSLVKWAVGLYFLIGVFVLVISRQYSFVGYALLVAVAFLAFKLLAVQQAPRGYIKLVIFGGLAFLCVHISNKLDSSERDWLRGDESEQSNGRALDENHCATCGKTLAPGEGIKTKWGDYVCPNCKRKDELDEFKAAWEAGNGEGSYDRDMKKMQDRLSRP